MAPEIQITRKQDEPGATTLAVEAPVEAVRAAEKRAASYYAKRARIPGFRKGRAPADVIRRRFGDAIKETVIRELVSDSWKQALDRESLEPIGEPQVLDLKFEDGQPVTFDFLVEVKPEIAVDRLGGFTVTRKLGPVTGELVDQQLEDLRRQKAPWIPVDGGEPKRGDLVHVSILTNAQDTTEEGKPYEFVLGEGQALDDVEAKVMTLHRGETIDTTVKFPDDFADETKRGQTISTRIVLHEAKRQELPELTDDFAREVGDFDTLDDLRAAIRTDLESSAAREADAEVRRQLVEQVTAANNVPAPRPMVDRLLRAYADAYQVPADQWEKFAGEFAPMVEAQVKRDLALDAIATKHDLRATEDDIDARIEEIAKNRGTEPGKVYAALQKENRIRELERSITEQKVFDLLTGQSTITES